MSFVLWCLFLTVLLFGVRSILTPFHRAPFLKLALLPGVACLTVTRVLTGLAVRAPLKKLNPPWRPGEPVEQERSPLQLIGVGLLSVVPFAVGIGLVVYLQSLLDPTFRVAEELPRLEMSSSAGAALAQASADVAQNLKGLVQHVIDGKGRAALFLYLAISILVYTAPPFRKFCVITACLGSLLIPVLAVDWLGLQPGFLSRAWFIERSYGPAVYQIVAMLFSLILLTLSLVAVARVALIPLRKGAGKKPADKKAEGKLKAVAA